MDTWKLVIIPSRDCIAVYRGAWWGPIFDVFWPHEGVTVDDVKAWYEGSGHSVTVA